MEQENKNIVHVPLNCIHCGFKCGFIEVSKGKTTSETPTQESLGFEDVRCDKCKIEYGDYPEMHARAKQAGLSHKEFRELMVKAGGKQKFFDPLLEEAIKNKTP